LHPKTNQFLSICPQESSFFPPKKPKLSISLIPSTSYFPNNYQPAPEPPQPHTDPLDPPKDLPQPSVDLPQPSADLPQPAADLSQTLEDDVLTKEKFLEIMEDFKDNTFNQLMNIWKQP
jgi:hypothetical protein